MKLEATRTDFIGNPTGMMLFQQAFIIYLATQGYDNFTHVLTIDPDGLLSCTIEPDLNDAQKDDLMHQLQTLTNVTIKDSEYVFA